MSGCIWTKVERNYISVDEKNIIDPFYNLKNLGMLIYRHEQINKLCKLPVQYSEDSEIFNN